MSGYNVIAGVYDAINAGIDYEKWGDRIEAIFREYSPHGSLPTLLLDLACGTGRMALTLARRGYDMIGVDGSEDMLADATDAMYRALETGALPADAPRPLFLCQDMRSFELYGTVGAVLCCLDSLNYLTGEGELAHCFSLVHNYLDPDGLFIFDMNTPHKFANVYGTNVYAYDLEEQGSFCVWQNYYDPDTRLCDFLLTLFEKQDDETYRRSDEEQCERCYSLDEIQKALEAAGFALLRVDRDLEGTPAGEQDDCERWYFTAQCKKEMLKTSE